jgi:hypothetical protein
MRFDPGQRILAAETTAGRMRLETGRIPIDSYPPLGAPASCTCGPKNIRETPGPNAADSQAAQGLDVEYRTALLTPRSPTTESVCLIASRSA